MINTVDVPLFIVQDLFVSCSSTILKCDLKILTIGSTITRSEHVPI